MLERVNNNAYKVELLNEYGVSATFYMDDFSSRSLEEGRYDEDIIIKDASDTTQGIGGLMTRVCVKKVKDNYDGRKTQI